jgi:hypothetical protein
MTPSKTYSLDGELYLCKKFVNGVGIFYQLDRNGSYRRGQQGMNGDDRMEAVISDRLHEMKEVELKTEQIKLEL